MRNLLYLFVFAALLLGLSACSSYYYSMLNSNDPVGEKNERGDFVQENDTVRISYRFWGENAPVTITIYNKLDEPLYVDWGRSALIIDDVATTYDPKVASVRGESSNVASGSSFHWSDRSSSGWSYSEGSFSGDVSLPKGVDTKLVLETTEQALLSADIFVLLVDHREFKRFNPAQAGKLTIDSRGIWPAS